MSGVSSLRALRAIEVGREFFQGANRNGQTQPQEKIHYC
jgi:hypothetical protein